MIKYLFTALILIGGFSLAPNVYSATYYIDTTQGQEGAGQCSTQDGLSTTTAFCNLDTFTEAARSAGDIAFMRRIATTTNETTSLAFTSDGTINSPISIQADYDNLWQDFATSSQTYTVAVGTSTLIASASITGIAAGDWIFFSGDCSERESDSTGTDLSTVNQCEFAYEVESIDGTLLNLYLPYKGNQSGSGLDLRVMPDNPQWNEAGAFNWTPDGDQNWFISGIHIKGTNSVLLLGSGADASGWVFSNLILQGATLINASSDINLFFSNSRFNSTSQMISASSVSTNGSITFVNAFIHALAGIVSPSGNDAYAITFKETFVSADTASPLFDCFSTGNYTCLITAQNFKYKNSGTDFADTGADISANFLAFEDFQGEIGRNKFFDTRVDHPTDEGNILSTTSASVLRSGGGNTSLEVSPFTNLNTSIEQFTLGHLKLFEYPIYTDTTSKQYDVYFLGSTSTDPDFRTNPTVDELWVECEYWAHNTTSDSLATSTRTIKKSTGTLNFVGQPSTWQSLSVTCQPTQTGILYLRGWYAKPEETTTDNKFFVDVKPVIQ